MNYWYAFDNQNLPEWVTEEEAKKFVSILNHYIPGEYGKSGTTYHLLNRHPSGRLYLHLLNRPTGV